MDPQSNMKAQRTADAYRAARLQAQQDQITAAGQRFANAVPFLPELGAAWSAGLRSLDDLSSGRGADFGQRWNQARAEQRAYADEFQGEHPVIGNMVGALGMAAPGVLASAIPLSRGAVPAPSPPVRALPPGAGRIAPALRRAAGSLGQNATAGALAGGAYGFSQPGTLDQRVRSARNAFIPGATGGAVAPLFGNAAAALARTPAVAATIRRSLSGAPEGRVFNDLANATDVDSRAFIGDVKPLAQTLTTKNQADWAEVNSLPAPVTTNRILEEPDVIRNFGAVMNDMEDEGKAPIREIPIANDYYNPIFGNHVPNFLLQLPTVEAVDATRRQVLDNVWQRYGASGRLELDPQGESLLGKANALGDLLSEGPDLTGQAYRRAFGGSGDEHALRTAFQSAQGKLIDPTLDPDEYQAWFGGLRPFEQQAARAAAAGDVLRAVQAGRTDIFQSPLVQRRMQAAFGSGSAADLLGNLRLENLASSLRLPGAQGGPWGDTQVAPELDATPRYGASASTVVDQPTPRAAFFPPPLAAWAAQQGQNQQ